MLFVSLLGGLLFLQEASPRPQLSMGSQPARPQSLLVNGCNESEIGSADSTGLERTVFRADQGDVKFYCKDGFVPRGGMFFCSDQGQWISLSEKLKMGIAKTSRVDPSRPCQRSVCDISALQRTTHYYHQTRFISPDDSDQVSVRFDDDFPLDADDSVRTNPAGNKLMSLEFFYDAQAPIKAGDMVEYECTYGEAVPFLSPDEEPARKTWVVKCLSDGMWEWQFDKEKCVKPCQLPDRSVLRGRSLFPKINLERDRSGTYPKEIANRTYLNGAVLFFACPAEDYYLDGLVREIRCANGKWSHDVEEWPSCAKKESCKIADVSNLQVLEKRDLPQFGGESDRMISDGNEPQREFVQVLGPGTEVTADTEIRVMCRGGYQFEDPDAKDSIRCLPSGQWNDPLPTCESIQSFNMKRFIVLVAVISLLLLILVILSVFLIQRQLWLRKMARVGGRHRRLVEPPSMPNLSAAAVGNSNPGIAPPAYPGSGSSAHHPDVHQDRLALIAFADGIADPPLPTYEDAVRPPAALDAISTLSGYASRLGRRLPSLSSLRSRDLFAPIRPLRETVTGPSAHSSHGGMSNVIQESTGTGSWETVGTFSGGASSGTESAAGCSSTGTAGPSDGSSSRTNGSTRAAAGSIEGSCGDSLHRFDCVSAGTDGEPLLEETSSSNESKTGSVC